MSRLVLGFFAIVLSLSASAAGPDSRAIKIAGDSDVGS